MSERCGEMEFCLKGGEGSKRVEGGRRLGTWEGPYTKRMMIGRLYGGTSCVQGRSGGDWEHFSDGKG